MNATELQAIKLELAKELKPVLKFKCQKGNNNSFTFKNTSKYPLQGIKINCPGCTKIHKVEDNTIEGLFKVSDQFHFSNEDQKLFNTQGFIVKPYENFIIMYFDDGEEINTFVNGILTPNPNKLKINLEFKAEVTVYR